jgi:G:T-mismatch repair DNA endonuclease (very short patch repair protein)
MGFAVKASFPIRGEDGRWAGIFDLALPARRLFIECHGDYWHGNRWRHQTPDAAQARNLGREIVKHAAARALGYEVRLLWEKSFRQDPCGACLAAVR